jgi:hypothetical protein
MPVARVGVPLIKAPQSPERPAQYSWRPVQFELKLGGKAPLKKVEEFLRNAAECRDMAEAAPSAHRQRLREMAETWERLAELEKRHPTG